MRRLREQETEEDTLGAPVPHVGSVVVAGIDVTSDASNTALESLANINTFLKFAHSDRHENGNKYGADKNERKDEFNDSDNTS